MLSAIVFLLIALITGVGGSMLAGDDDGPWWIPILFACPVGLLTQVLPESSDVVVAAATLAVVTMVSPLRRWRTVRSSRLR